MIPTFSVIKVPDNVAPLLPGWMAERALDLGSCEEALILSAVYSLADPGRKVNHHLPWLFKKVANVTVYERVPWKQQNSCQLLVYLYLSVSP